MCRGSQKIDKAACDDVFAKMLRITHTIFQCCSMFVISSVAVSAVIATALAGWRVNEPAFYVLWGISAAYFFGDFVYLVVAEPAHLLVACHHLVALSALGFMLAFSQFRLFMILIGLHEISTFFMFLKRVEELRAWKAELEVAFIACWIVFRGMLSPLLVAGAVVVLVENVSAAAGVHLAFQTFFFLCNVYWTVELIKSRWRRRNGLAQSQVF